MENVNTHRRGIVVVLGMHRSGTSAVTRSLQTLGVWLGDNLLTAGFDNPKGFWEDRDCVAINEELLNHFHSAWNRLDLAWNIDLNDPAIANLYSRAITLVSKNICKHSVWGVKDPRMCRVLGFWKQVFAECSGHVSYVIVLRHPISVAESLKNRDNIPLDKSHFLWLQHMVPAVLESQGATRTVVDYDLLLESPIEQVTRLASALKMPLDASNNSALNDFAAHFLDKDLRHSHYPSCDVLSNDTLPLDVFKIYELLFRAARDQLSIDSHECHTIFDQVSEKLRGYQPAFLYVNRMESERLKLYKRIDYLTQQVSELTRQTNGLNKQLFEIQNSATWTIAQYLQKKRLILLPDGSKRKETVRALLRSFRL